MVTNPNRKLQIFQKRQKNKIENSIVIHYAGTTKEIRIKELKKIYKNL